MAAETNGRAAGARKAHAAVRARGDRIRAAIVALLRYHGTLTTSDLAAEVYLSRFGVLYHLRALESDGLITRDRRTGTPAPRWSLTRKARRP